MTTKLPELLAPAGSPEALEAALSAGADAVYLGGTRFNARMSAHNFDKGALAEAVTHAHRLGGRVYLTLNTLLWDRELDAAVEAAYEAATLGVDALIIADTGAASLIHRALPNLPLHASTQLSGHNAALGGVLRDWGFSRFVIARETSFPDLAQAVEESPLEVEVFIHGALCVSHSGQCLFSSVIGGRSGNRGECAQPCRLPYEAVTANDSMGGYSRPRGECAQPCRLPYEAVTTNGSMGGYGRPTGQRKSRGQKSSGNRPGEDYPLSLKDLSLARQIPALLACRPASLKIEGRLKAPAYVGGVTAIWRRLLDEHRSATPEEWATLCDLFSREGFTDGYQTGHIDNAMAGIRSQADKERTAALKVAAAKPQPRLPLTVTLTVAEGQPTTLVATAPLYRQGDPDKAMGATAETPSAVTVTVVGDPPQAATNSRSSLTPDMAGQQLSRTGGTPYYPAGVVAHIESPALMLPLSALNALRREALERLDAARLAALPDPSAGYHPLSENPTTRSADPSPAAASGRSGDPEDAARPHGSDDPRDARASRPTRTARFATPRQITPAAVDGFDILYLPVGLAHPAEVPPQKRGLLLPPVIFDREMEAARQALCESLDSGVTHVLVGNPGHLPLVRATVAAYEAIQGTPGRVTLHGDFRLNITNAPAARVYAGLGLSDLILSPELTLPRMRDIARCPGVAVGAIVYGRLPLMLLEKCVIRQAFRHLPRQEVCGRLCPAGRAALRDRMGVEFPLLRETGADGQAHRTLVYNSLPLSMSDRPDDLSRLGLAQHHFIFSTESPTDVDAVLRAYATGAPLGQAVRRMGRS